MTPRVDSIAAPLDRRRPRRGELGPRGIGALVAHPRWHWLALLAILALSAWLELFRLGREGWGNPYYAATVKSMLTGWHNFFFAAYDPGGFVSVDKPPLGFWLQAASAKLFGFHGISLLLPQAVSAVGAVALLYYLVRRAFGTAAGLLAAAALAVTPVSVATARNNTIDSPLVLVLLGAAWAVSRAVEPGRAHLRWLLLAMALTGAGFNIKMLQAYLPLPAFYLLYLLAAPVNRRRRIAHLGLGTLVLAVTSLWWAVVVDLTPADKRPYVGSSGDNTVRELVLGHNGLARLLPGRQLFGGRGQPVGGGPPGDAGGSPVGMRPPSGQAGGQARLAVPSGENEPGLLRLFRPMLATQVSWLLPLALIGVPLLAWQNWPLKWRRGGLEGPDAPSGSDALAGDRRRWQGLLLWGGWLLSTGGYFTVGNMFHAYYLVMLAPAVAALFGAGIVALWQERRRGRWGWLLLPAALGLTAAVQAGILAEYPDWRRWLVPLVGGLCAAAVIGLGAMRRAGRRAWIRRAGTALAAAGVLGLLVTPAVWSVYTAWNAPVGGLPSAGPPPIARSASGAQGTAPMVLSGAANAPRGDRPPVDPTSQVDPKLLEYLRSNRRTARFIVAVPSSAQASGIILATGLPVMALGGFNGSDAILDTDTLAKLVSDGVVRFFLVPREDLVPGPLPADASPPDRGPATDASWPSQGPPAGTSPQGQGPAADATPAQDQGPPNGPAPVPGGGVQSELMDWVRQHCGPVPAGLWQSSSADSGGVSAGDGGFPGAPGRLPGNQLYDCGGAAARR